MFFCMGDVGKLRVNLYTQKGSPLGSIIINRERERINNTTRVSECVYGHKLESRKPTQNET